MPRRETIRLQAAATTVDRRGQRLLPKIPRNQLTKGSKSRLGSKIKERSCGAGLHDLQVVNMQSPEAERLCKNRSALRELQQAVDDTFASHDLQLL